MKIALSAYRFIENHKIHILLISLIMMILIPPFLNHAEDWMDLYIKGDFLLIVIACFLIVKKFRVSRIISQLTFLLIIVDWFMEHDILDYVGQVGLTWVILHAFVLVLREAMSLKGDTKNLILVSITGYMIIGFLGGLASAALNYVFPGSYVHNSELVLDLYHFIYFGYVTMTTLGYGDIIPLSYKAQAVSLVLVICGQLFLSVIIAINIAKFMQKMK